jgi:cytochrome c-type biogenesis protein CcmH/NrfG
LIEPGIKLNSEASANAPLPPAAWEKLLKLNPNFPQKAVIEHMITEAKQQKTTGQSSNPPKG